jgi:hypothetical protein
MMATGPIRRRLSKAIESNSSVCRVFRHRNLPKLRKDKNDAARKKKVPASSRNFFELAN